MDILFDVLALIVFLYSFPTHDVYSLIVAIFMELVAIFIRLGKTNRLN